MVSNGFVGAGLGGGYLDLISFSWLRVTTQVSICCTAAQAEIKQGFLPGKKYWLGLSFASSFTYPRRKPGWWGALSPP